MLTSRWPISSLLLAAICVSPGFAANKTGTHVHTPKFKPRYTGLASWYGNRHQGHRMANHERFDARHLTAASWYFPLGSVMLVVNLENGKSAVVTITDRGPDRRLHRVIDVSEAAAEQLDFIHEGLTPVFVSPALCVDLQQSTYNTELIEP